MKKVIFILFVCSSILNVAAQRLDIDKAWFEYSYRRLPNQVLDPTYKTYAVNITKTVALDAYSNESANGLINIEGKKKVEGPAHIKVSVNLNDLIIEKSEVVERVEVQKDKEGKETGRSYYYHVSVIYSFEASAQAKDCTGKTLSNYTMADRSSKKEYKTSEVSKSSVAADYYNNNKLEIKTQLISEQIKGSLQTLNAHLNNDFGYKVIRTRENLWTLGSEKHPEYKAYQDACNAGKSAMEIITCDMIAEDVKVKMQPAIEYFMGIDKKYANAEEKAEKKLRYGAYFNLAELYMFTEQFDKAKEYAQKLVANDFDPKDGERMIKEIDAIVADLQKHSYTTRHFLPDLENIQLPM